MLDTRNAMQDVAQHVKTNHERNRMGFFLLISVIANVIFIAALTTDCPEPPLENIDWHTITVRNCIASKYRTLPSSGAIYFMEGEKN